MKTQLYQKQKSMYIFFGKILIFLTIHFLTTGLSPAQNLYIRSTGETGPTSGTNWSISGGTLTVSGGTASINASVIINYLQNTGNLTLFAPGGIYIRQTINPALPASRNLIFKANGFVFNEDIITCSGNALNVVLWSDADGNNDGRIILYEETQIVTNNGHVWLGGGGGSTSWNGLTVGNSAAVAASTNIYGINVQGATINAGTGDVYMNGRSYGTTGDYRFGVRIADYGDVNFSSVICHNLDITGVASAGSGSNNYHDGVNINTFSTLTISGNLNITGTGGGGNSTGNGNYGISIDSSTITVTGSGQITLVGYGGLGSGGYNYGVSFSNKTSVVANSGNVNITAVNGTATTIGFKVKNTSVLKSGASGTGSGNITIIADDIDFADAASQISSSGSITIRPYSNNSSIGIGSGTGGTMELLGSYFTNNISSNFSNITIGGSNSGSIAIKEAYFRSPVIFQGASGTQLQPTTNVDITGKTLTLGDNLTLNESNGVLYGTSGTITATRVLVNPSSVNVAGLGAVISSASTLGSTIITRGHTAQSGLVSGASGIARYYDISPNTNSGLNATFVFQYSAMDVNTLNEDAFGLFKSTNGGASYTRQNGTPDAAGNTVTLSGVGSFSRWTVGESCLNPSTAGTISSNHTICYNNSASTLTGTAPSGYFGDLEYNWQKSTLSDASGFSTISGATASSYSPGTLTQTTWFKRLAKVTCSETWPASGTSNVVTVTVRPQFTAGTIAGTGETICYNTNPATAIGNTTSGSGGDGTITYSWRSSADNYTNAIAGATSATYTPAGPLTSSTSYRRYVKDGTCNTTPEVSTGTWSVTVRPQFTSGTISSTGETICYNTNPATAIGNTTSGSGGDGTITYSWRSSADNYTNAIAGATSATYTPAGPLTSSTSYRRYVKDGTCNTTPEVSTGTWSVTVRPQFTSGTISSTGETICYNTNPATAIGNTTSGSGGDGTITYSWRSSADNYTNAIAGATSATYTPAGPLTSSTSYRRYVKDGTCNTTPEVSTGTWSVTVRPQFTSGTISSTGETICYNTNPATVIGNTTSGSGGDGTITYSWRSSADNYTNVIAGATNATYTPAGPLTSSTGYRRYVKDGTCNTTPEVSTGTWTVTVRPQFTAGAIKTDGDTICYGGDPGLIGNETTASGGAGRIAYRWQSSTDNITFLPIVTAATGSTYDPPDGLTQTTWYQRQATDSTCNTTFTNSTGTWKVLVFPTTVGGTSSGGMTVCYGSHSTVLTLSGHTGSVVSWQSSTDSIIWNDIAGSTQTTFTAENLTENTWYRAVVKSGICLTEYSSPTKITMFTNYKISGTSRYNNNPLTLLNGLKIFLYKNTVLVDSTVTGTDGSYLFDNLTNGNYDLVVKSSHPSGQWQTWGGVNNTDYLLVSKHIAGTQFLPVNPPVIRTAASVKLPHPAINTLDATAIRQAAKFPTTGYTYFDTARWVFSGLDVSQVLTGITLNCADVVREIRGLCAGDVNGTWVPAAGYKTADPGLEIVHQGTLPLTQEMIFPIRIEETHGRASLPYEIGAITLYLDFDPSLITVTDVTIPGNGGEEPWFITNGHVLTTGWMSLNPIMVENGKTLLLVHARLKDEVPVNGADPRMTGLTPEIRFLLNESPLSELADADGNVIPDVKLIMPVAAARNIENQQNGTTANVWVYPNPATEKLNVEVESPSDGTLHLELVNMNGVTVMKPGPVAVNAGWDRTQLDVGDLVPGVFFLRVNLSGTILIRKVTISRP